MHLLMRLCWGGGFKPNFASAWFAIIEHSLPGTPIFAIAKNGIDESGLSIKTFRQEKVTDLSTLSLRSSPSKELRHFG